MELLWKNKNGLDNQVRGRFRHPMSLKGNLGISKYKQTKQCLTIMDVLLGIWTFQSANKTCSVFNVFFFFFRFSPSTQVALFLCAV